MAYNWNDYYKQRVTAINKVKNLYQTCLDNDCGIEISFHDKDDLDIRIWAETQPDKFKVIVLNAMVVNGKK